MTRMLVYATADLRRIETAERGADFLQFYCGAQKRAFSERRLTAFPTLFGGATC